MEAMEAVAKLVAYLWINFLNAEDKLESDFSRAVPCDACGALIVHTYTVEKADGTVVVVGRECAHKAMGWNAPRPKVLRKVEQESLAASKRKAAALETAIKYAVESPVAAQDACKARNHGRDFPMVTFEVGDGKFYSLPANCASDLAEALLGWS